MQAEIWRAASHSRLHARYFRLFPGFLGLKSFLNFFKKRVLGPIFALQSSFEGGSESSFTPPPCTLCVPNFLKIFSFCTTSRQSANQTTRQSDSLAANPPKQSPRERSQNPHPTPHPPPKTKTCQNFWRQRKSPEANLGALVERLTRLELATSTLARWCSTN